MCDESTRDHDDLLLSTQRRIDRQCQAFEDAWVSGNPAPLEHFMEDVSETEKLALFQELLFIDLAYRRERGDVPTVASYAARFPEYQHLIVEALDSTLGRPSLSTTSKYAVNNGTGDNLVGEAISHYRVVRLLGRGGFGAVYLAEDKLLGRSVAVKLLRRERDASEADTDRLLEEARTSAALKHDGIVPVYDAGFCQDKRLYVVMEYVEGRSLEQLLPQGQPPFDQTVEWMAAVSDAVDYAHLQGFIHRDLKPANILLDGDRKPRVVDFGLALHEDKQHARVGEWAGTLPYMAPEQVRGETHRLDGRTDIWAIGVILYEMLANRRPFHGINAKQLIDEILERDPKPLRQLDPDIPKELEQVCLKCLAKPVGDRYLTAADVARDLRRWKSSFAPAPNERTIATPPRFSRFAQIALAATLTLGLVAIALTSWNSPGPDRPELAQLAGNVKAVLDTTYSAQLPGDSPTANVLLVAQNQTNLSAWHRVENGSSLSSADNYRILVQPTQPSWCYVFQIDSSGRLDWLFPQNANPHSMGTNPVAENQWQQIPPNGQAFHLDDTSGIEHLYVAVTSQPWPELESVLTRASRENVAPDEVRDEFNLATRGVAGVRPAGPAPVPDDVDVSTTDLSWIKGADGVLVEELWFRHVAIPPTPSPSTQ